MSARVVTGFAPAGKPHPSIKWSLLMALLVVVLLGVPKFASAHAPVVQAPTGARSGGVFTGPYSFSTRISCPAGLSFSSSYSNNLDGAHNFAFYGAPDGSLLVAIDGGGMQLVTSCGHPYDGPPASVAAYSAVVCSSCAAPAPTPAPAAGRKVGGWPPLALAGLGAAVIIVLALLLSRRLRYVLAVRLSRAAHMRLTIHARDQPKRRGLSPHLHTGKVLAHHHTSYAALGFLLLLCGVLTAAASVGTHAGSSLLSLTVSGPPPTTAATIDSPTDGQHVNSADQTVRGTCPSGVFVEIWRNGIFAGSTVCDINGLYSQLITLVPGQNNLIARVSDALGQYGPDSSVVIVYYDVPPPPTPSPTPSPTPHATATPIPAHTPTSTPKPTPRTTPTPVPALIITSDEHVYQGGQPDTPVEWTINLSGGRPPYHLTWEWGDGTSDTTFLQSAGPATFQHQYAQPGTYQVTIRATDSAGREAVIQVVVIINGPAMGGIIRDHDGPGNLIFIWPMLIITSLIVFSFWLGERHKLSTAGPLIDPQAV